MFRQLRAYNNCFSIKVGAEASYARYNLQTPQMIVSLLEKISAIPLHVVELVPV
jgi:trehalose 6-phosphate synthase/phosphatase